MFPHPVTGQMVEGIQKVRYSHDAMIDLLISDPTVKQNDLAILFGRTPGWISHVINCDAFQARLEERKAELVDPAIRASVNERLRAVADAALQKVLERVASPVECSDDFLIKSAKLAADALGYGARAPQGQTTNVAVVVQVPSKIPNSSDWAAAHAHVSAPLVERVA